MDEAESSLLAAMTRQAESDAVRARQAGNEQLARYMEGWADGLLTFREHLGNGVRASCYPAGSCSCHPLLR